MKNLKNKTLIISFVSLAFFVFLIYMIFFNKSFLNNNFMYKFSKIKEQTTSITNMDNNIKTLQSDITGKQNAIAKKKKSVTDESVNFPKVVDEPSLLIYIENKSLINNVYIEKIGIDNKETKSPTNVTPQTNTNSNTTTPANTNNTNPNGTKANGNTNTTTNGSNNVTTTPATTTTPPATTVQSTSSSGVKKVTSEVIIHGSYENIEKFIKDLNDDIGKYNYISYVLLTRGEQESLSNSKDKNIICNIKIELNYAQ